MTDEAASALADVMHLLAIHAEGVDMDSRTYEQQAGDILRILEASGWALSPTTNEASD